MDYTMALSLEFLKSHPLDAARVLERIPIHDMAPYLTKAPPDIAATIIKTMDSLTMIRCFEMMEPDAISPIAEKLPLEIAAMIFRKMDSTLKDPVMNKLPPDILKFLNLLLRFPEGTAGALMDPRYLVLPQDIQVKEAIRRVRYHLKQNTSRIYIVDRDQLLIGFINIHELLPLDPKTLISTILRKDIWKLSAHSDTKAILMSPGWREFHALPVVDTNGIFLGAVDYRTFRRLEQEVIKAPHHSPLSETAASMGELFWVGMSGIVKGVASALSLSKE